MEQKKRCDSEKNTQFVGLKGLAHCVLSQINRNETEKRFNSGNKMQS
jgi:hypothetical protein